MNGGYGTQPNFAVLALLPAPPGMTSLACSKSSRERLVQAVYLVSNVTSLPHVPGVSRIVPCILCILNFFGLICEARQASPYCEPVISFEAASDRLTQAQADLLVVPCHSDSGSSPVPGPGAAEAATALGIDLAATLGARGFTGEIGDTFATLALGRLAASGVLFVGFGVREQTGNGAVRQAAMRAAGEMSKAARIAVVLPDADQAVAAALAEGVLLGAYQFDRYRRQPVAPGWRPPILEHVSVLTSGAREAAVDAGLRRGQAMAELTNWVRDMVNASPSDTTPDDMANQAHELADTHGLACSVMTVPDLAEVRDTDAEGRLIIADSLAYLAERNPAVLVDVATLTDAAGLGEGLWAVLGTDEQQIGLLVDAGREAGDPGWHLPLPRAYRRYFASAAADVRNTPAGVPDTTVMAATDLREFTSDLPWMHIGNGSTAYLDRPGDGWPEGATGSPARALLRWLEQWAG